MASLRPAREDDLLAIVGLWNREGGPTRHAGQVTEIQILFRQDPDALVVAEVDGQLVGTLIVGWDGWRCHVYRLVVEPGARRSGVALQLVQAATHRARELGAARVDAMVDPDNAGAIAFWHSAGFALDADHRWSVLL